MAKANIALLHAQGETMRRERASVAMVNGIKYKENMDDSVILMLVAEYLAYLLGHKEATEDPGLEATADFKVKDEDEGVSRPLI